MKKRLSLIVAILFAFIFTSCQNKSLDNSPSPNNANQETSLQWREEIEMSDCILFINQKIFSEGTYAKINRELKYEELPILAIAKELGAEIKWIDSNVITVSYKEKSSSFDISKKDYGYYPPPGTKKIVRKLIGNEIIMDGDSVRIFLRSMMGAQLTVDYDKMMICIDETGQ